jgi:hypothetical protein
MNNETWRDRSGQTQPVTQEIDLLREHNERVTDIEWEYKWRLVDLHELMGDAVRTRDRKIAESWERYLKDSKDE